MSDSRRIYWVHNPTGEVVNYRASLRDDKPTPIARPGVDETVIEGDRGGPIDASYDAAESAKHAIRHPGLVVWDSATSLFDLPPDPRPFIDISHDISGGNELDYDGVSTCTITIRWLDADGNLDATKQGPAVFQSSSGALWRFHFTDGVATKTYTAHKSGELLVESTRRCRVLTPMQIDAVIP